MDQSASTRERHAKIINLLSERQEISVKELSDRFAISEVTIRKDLTTLQKRNLLLRTRGGAMRIPVLNNKTDTPIAHKKLYNFQEKRAIGRLAASLIKEGETILIDSGTTTLEIAKNLDKFTNLTIITNALNIAAEVLQYNRFKVILLGGYIRSASQSMVGPFAEATLKNLYCDKLFLGVDSFSIERGISTPDIEEASINQTMISISREVIAVCDYSKFNKRSLVHIANVDQIQTVVTDKAIPSEIKSRLKSMEISCLVAG